MSRIFKSNYVKIGTPKHIKSNAPVIQKREESKMLEPQKSVNAEAEANNIIEDAKEMYLRIIEEANNEAKKVLEAAQDEKEVIYESSAQQGYSEGINAGYAEGKNQAEGLIQQAMDIKMHLDERQAQIYKEAETEIMLMVLDIAKKVIGEELTQNPDMLHSLIKQALFKCAFKDKLTIRVSEQDYDYINSTKDKIIMLTEGINNLEIYCDKALLKGSCIVETPSGEINAGINVQINEIQKAFEYLMRNE